MMKSQPPIPKSQGIPNPQIPMVREERKPHDIRERTFQFALKILDLTSRLPGTPEAFVARDQLARAGASIGANVEEADGALTKADARRILGIARKEAREVRYWLRIIEGRWGSQIEVGELLKESAGVLSILSAIIGKL